MGTKPGTGEPWRKLLDEILVKAQTNKACHNELLKKLHKSYQQLEKHPNQKKCQAFLEYFLSDLQVCLSIGQKQPHVENTLDFCAKFIVHYCDLEDEDEDEDENQENEDEETSRNRKKPSNGDSKRRPRSSTFPFFAETFKRVLGWHDNQDSNIRFRVCHFINLILQSMGEQAYLSDDLCEAIVEHMSKRIMDTNPKVRAQAVFALYRLQEPQCRDCRVIRMYVFHLSRDPSVDVRKAVMLVLGKNKDTLEAVFKRTLDVDEGVRKLAYDFLGKISHRSLTIKQREELLNRGLRDHSKLVRNAVRNSLLQTWFLALDRSFLKLLEILDVECGKDTAVLTLKSMFESAELEDLPKELPLDKATKLVPLQRLSSEVALYWRCLAEHLFSGEHQLLEELLPELTSFCNYVRAYIDRLGPGPCSRTDLFVLQRLLEITRCFDLTDESGRASLQSLVLDALKNEVVSDDDVVAILVESLETIIPRSLGERLRVLGRVVDEIWNPPCQGQMEIERDVDEGDLERKRTREEELRARMQRIETEEYEAVRAKDYSKARELSLEMASVREELKRLNPLKEELEENQDQEEEEEERRDPEVTKRCLRIVSAAFQLKSVRSLDPVLRNFLDRIVLPSIAVDPNQQLGLKILGIGCLLEREFARRYLALFYLVLSSEQGDPRMWVLALQVIVDLLGMHGFETFQDDETSPSLVDPLVKLLSNENAEVRTCATKGVCKLLLNGKIYSSSILARLLILFHNPVDVEDLQVQACLRRFFPKFVAKVPGSLEMLESAFLPVLHTLARAPATSPLSEIDPLNVARLILSLTAVPAGHKNLAYRILDEILNPKPETNTEVLILCLKDLRVNLEDDEQQRRDLGASVQRILQETPKTEKKLRACLLAFQKSLEKVGEAEVMDEEQEQEQEQEKEEEHEEGEEEEEEEEEEEIEGSE